MTAKRIPPDQPDYPPLATVLPKRPPITIIGNPALIRTQPVALLCSIKCPGEVILRLFDLARALRDTNVPTIGGFHSPMESECLTLLLRGKQPVIVCPARGIDGMRMPSAWKSPLADGRLLVLSPFGKSQRRPTTAAAELRNRVVAELGEVVFVAYAAPGGKVEQLCRELLRGRKQVMTFDARECAGLTNLGAQGADLDQLVAALRKSDGAPRGSHA